MSQEGRDKPLYMISVAAELTGMHPQTLRVYESKGLVNPKRSGGNTRLYSQSDIERLELINQLTDEGINLAGVVMRILDMKERAEERERENEKLREQLRRAQEELHELKMQKRITALAPRDGSANPEQVLRGLLAGAPYSAPAFPSKGGTMTERYKFSDHAACEFYPCHDMPAEELNCLFLLLPALPARRGLRRQLLLYRRGRRRRKGLQLLHAPA